MSGPCAGEAFTSRGTPAELIREHTSAVAPRGRVQTMGFSWSAAALLFRCGVVVVRLGAPATLELVSSWREVGDTPRSPQSGSPWRPGERAPLREGDYTPQEPLHIPRMRRRGTAPQARRRRLPRFSALSTAGGGGGGGRGRRPDYNFQRPHPGTSRACAGRRPGRTPPLSP